jgi:hypothetical protein
MQNKPNSLDARMNVSSFATRYYENLPLRRRGENKPNTTPIKANLTYPESHALPALSLSKGATPKGAEQKSDAATDVVQETWVGIIKGIRKLQDASASNRRPFGQGPFISGLAGQQFELLGAQIGLGFIGWRKSRKKSKGVCG